MHPLLSPKQHHYAALPFLSTSLLLTYQHEESLFPFKNSIISFPWGQKNMLQISELQYKFKIKADISG